MENGIIQDTYGDYDRAATRLQFVTILSGALPESVLAQKNQVADNAIPDVKATDTGADGVYLSETAAIITRMVKPELRKTVTLDGTSIPKGEYERSIWYGFAEAPKDPDAAITEAQFTAMLSRMVEKYGSKAIQKWKSVSFVKDADDSPVFRFYGAILLLYAAEATDLASLPDGIYPTIKQNANNWDWSEFWQLDWEQTDGWSEETFAEISQAMTDACQTRS